MGRDLADRIGATRVKRRRLALRRMGRAKHLGRTSLVDPDRPAASGDMIAHGVEHSQRPGRHHVGGVFRHVKRHAHVALSREIIDLLRLNLLQHPSENRAVRHVAIMQRQFAPGTCWS